MAMSTRPQYEHPIYDEHGRYTPDPGTEYPFSISDIARASTPLLGDDWHAESGVFGVTGHIESPDGALYLLAVGDTGDMTQDLYVQHDDDQRTLPSACASDGLDWLANTVSITIRQMHHQDDTWDAGRHLVTALAAHGRHPVIDFHAGTTTVTLPSHDGGALVITGIDRARKHVGTSYSPDNHAGWAAHLNTGDSSVLLFRTPVLAYEAEFAEDTAALLNTVLPYAPK